MSRRRFTFDQRKRMCGDKNHYDDKKAAVSAKNKALRNRGRHGRPDSLRAYPCPLCHGWHLTKGEDTAE